MNDFTPAEKAKDIADKIEGVLALSIPTNGEPYFRETIKCSLVVLDEILDGFRKLLPSSRTYWESVRDEIEKLPVKK